MDGISRVIGNQMYSEGRVQTGVETEHAAETQAEAGVKETGETEKISGQENQGMAAVDEYISSEKSGQKPTGLYRLEKDTDGKAVIKYDDPRKAKEMSGEASSDLQLQRKKDSLKQQIRQNGGNQAKVAELKKKLAEVEKQLKQVNG